MNTATYVYDAYRTAISAICTPDDKTIAANVAAIRRMDPKDTCISFAVIDFLAANITNILTLFSMSYDDIIEAGKNAVKAEIMIDELSAEDRKTLRNAMQKKDHRNSKFNLILGKTMFDPNTIVGYMNTARNAFAKSRQENIGAVMEYAMNVRSEADERDTSYVLSNFAYLLRAFEYNDLFRDHVKQLIVKFNEAWSAKKDQFADGR